MAYGDYRDFSPGGEQYDPEQFRADEIARGNATGTNATHGGSLEEIQAALDQMSQDPAIMGQLQQGHTQFVQTELAKRGLALPRHYALDVDGGRIVPREQGKWERWKTPILLTAAMFGGGFAAEALMGAGTGGLAAAEGLEAGATTGLGGATIPGVVAPAIGATAAGTAAPAALSAAALEGGATSGLAGSGLAPTLGSTVTGQAMSTLPAAGHILSTAATPSILGAVGKAGPILAKGLANHNAGKRLDEQTQLTRDQVALNSYNSGLAAPTKRLTTSQNASILKNWTPVTSNWGGPGSVARGQVPSFSGGYANPDLIDPRTKTLANDVIDQQLQQQLAGGGIDRGGPPAIAPHPKNKAWENILGGVATGADILGSVYGGG